MTEQSNQHFSKDQLSAFLYFLSVYSIGIGMIYNWSYWSIFEVNIFEYLSFTDILKTSILPVALNIVFCVFVICFNHNLHAINKIVNNKKKSGIITKIWTIFYDDMASTVLFIFIFIFLEYIGLKNSKYFAYFFFGIFLNSLAGKVDYFKSLIPNSFVRWSVLFILFIQIPQAYDYGEINAHQILNEKRFLYLVSEIDGLNNPKNENPLSKLRLIGHTDELFFFFDPSNKTLLITKFKDNKPLILKVFNKYA